MEESPSFGSDQPALLRSFPTAPLFGACSVTQGLGWNTALGDSCPHQQTASLNLIKMSFLSVLFLISQL